MVGVIWYRFVRYSGTDWSATLVPIRPLLWYRLERCAGTDSSATVVPIRRYYQHRTPICHDTVYPVIFSCKINPKIRFDYWRHRPLILFRYRPDTHR